MCTMPFELKDSFKIQNSSHDAIGLPKTETHYSRMKKYIPKWAFLCMQSTGQPSMTQTLHNTLVQHKYV